MLDSLKSANMVQADQHVKASTSIGWDASTEKALLAKLTDLTIRVSVPSGMNAVQDFRALHQKSPASELDTLCCFPGTPGPENIISGARVRHFSHHLQ